MPSERLLRVTAPHFVAGMVLTPTDAGWTVTQCAPILARLQGLAPTALKAELERRGWSWEWVHQVAEGDRVTPMPRSRKTWIAHLQDHDPALVAQIQEFATLFGAKVMALEHPCPECAWSTRMPQASAGSD